ncbi:hypothetical protein F2Q70_00010221 [Brassica cretica]|uniref:Uncharacterized protein n=1 Tax=Brassica cretica TaxID=69181 RepID=A0A8S9M638_BRACR|nr:hypothetical protein F2Q70_00010221 [Brassica cretica]
MSKNRRHRSSGDGTVVGAQVMERRQREASVVERQGREAQRRAKKAESDAPTMDPTTGKATVAEEVPGAGAGDSMVAAVAELTNTAETKRATKK